jgi:SAM-dependent methyltransferase
MNTPNIAGSVDSINQRSMRGAVGEYSALVSEGLTRQEQAALDSVHEQIRGKRILDLGVGAGRTVKPLLSISKDYVGIDYVQEMVDRCRREHPGVRFERADARSLSSFADESFDLIVFSCNGICMVDHPGRLSILSEVKRLLSPQGVFIFSTCNRNSAAFEAVFTFPEFERARNPLRAAVRTGRFALHTLYRLINRLRHYRHEISEQHYAIRNDIYHHYGTMLYFIDIESQTQQLHAAGFADGVRVFDLSGLPADRSCRDRTLGFVAQKPSPSRPS